MKYSQFLEALIDSGLVYQDSNGVIRVGMHGDFDVTDVVVEAYTNLQRELDE